MPRNLMSRRRILKSSLGALLLLPLLRQRKLQAQAANPKRLVLAFTPDSNPPEWWPTAGGELGFTLQGPLEDFRGLEQHLMFIRQLDHSWTYDNHHVAGIVQLFTGARWVAQGSNEYAAGPSIDQVLLRDTDIRGGTARPSIHLGADDGRTDARHIICYTGSGQPIINEINPQRAFDDIFDGVTFGGTQEPPDPPDPSDPAAEREVAVEQRQLDVNVEELREIQRFLGQEEREKLELHVTSLEELRARITAAPGGDGGPVTVGGTCEEVATRSFSSRDLTNETALTEWARIQADLIVNAFTCDRTRIASLSFSFSGGHHNGLLGFSGSWHDDVAHVSRTNDSVSVRGQTMTTRQAFIEFSRYWGSHIAYLTRRLSEITEGDGSMLDNTLVIWGVESGTNHSHNPRDMQYLLAGGRNMGFQTGQFLQLPSTQSVHRLHTSVLNGFGHPAAGFGIEPSSGPLAGVVG